MKPRLLDLFSGAGGCARGYQMAGFHVTGVDIKAQPRYAGDVFIQGDALEFVAAHGHEFDAIHASPPCQAFTSAQAIRGRAHNDLLTPCRAAIETTGLPAVIENVVGAPMRADVMLCGTMFGLGVPAKRGFLARHRLFEFVNFAPPMLLMPACSHVNGWRSVGVYGHTGNGKGGRVGSGNHGWLVDDWREAMGIDWMVRDELAQAIPPTYTHFIGNQLLSALSYEEAA